jgi:simple sugar transport system permease protein
VTAEPTGGGVSGGMSLNTTSLLSTDTLGRQLASTAVAVLLGLLVGAVLIWLSSALSETGFDPWLPVTAYLALLDGSLLCEEGFQEGSFLCAEGGILDFRSIGNVFNSAAPLMLAGLSVAFGFRAGLFNIGAQGQFFLGAFGSAVVGAAIGLPFPVAMFVSLAAGFVAGGFWGFIPGILKAWRGAHEVVTTIMLNTIAAYGLSLLASTVFKDPNATTPRTPDINPDAALPILIEGTRMHAGILVAVGAALVVWFVLFKTTFGFEVRTVGANPNAARYAGINPSLITVMTMTIAGGLAGLAGSVEVLGINKNYVAEQLGVTIGFDGITVALLGRAHPFGVVGAALLFGVLRAGAGSMQRQTDPTIPIDIIVIVQGAIILFVAAEVVIRRLLPWGRSRAAPAGPAPAGSPA